MNTDEDAAHPHAGEWAAIEARFQRAKQALCETQQRHCEAAHEFLLARAQVRQMLEAVFPGMEADSSRPASGAHCGCNEVAAHPQDSRLGASYAAPQSSRATPRTQEEAS